MVSWPRVRVRNFTERSARIYATVLVGLDGHVYDQATFFRCLVDAGLRDDVPQGGTAEDVRVRRFKRWDSYSNKIREFGLGFAMVESKKGAGAEAAQTIWRASGIAKMFVEGRLDYRQFMAIQLMRTQLPKPKLPLDEDQMAELQRGAMVRPLALVLSALDVLASLGADSYLTRDEIFRHLAPLDVQSRLPQAVRQIIADRARQLNPSPAPPVGSGSADIWLNEFEATGYIRQLRGSDATLIVRALARVEEARRLMELIPVQAYDTSHVSISRFFDFFSSAPSTNEMEALRMQPRVVQIDVPKDAAYEAETSILQGSLPIVGGLQQGDLVVLVGADLDPRSAATVFEVVEAATRYAQPIAGVQLKPKLTRVDHQAIVMDEAQ